MKARGKRSELELIGALGVVGFELRMMAHAANLLSRAGADDDLMAKNAYVDSAHLHARVLVDFFLGSERDSDIRRTDFVPEWAPKPAEAVMRLNDNKRLLNKYLAHLTWERVSRDAPAWDYPGIATDVIDVAERWTDHLASTAQLLGDTLRPHVILARQTLDGRVSGITPPAVREPNAYMRGGASGVLGDLVVMRAKT